MALDPACRYVIYRCNTGGRNCGATKWRSFWPDMPDPTPVCCAHGARAEDDWESQRQVDGIKPGEMAAAYGEGEKP